MQTDENSCTWTLENTRGLLEVTGGTLRPGGIEQTEHAIGSCELAEGSRILDAGCGTAATARHLIEARKLRAFGVDRSATLLAEARCRSGEMPLVRAAIESLPFRDASLDGVICECVLSQTRSSEVLREFRRVLRGNGLLILSDLYRKIAADPPADWETAGRPATRARLTAMVEDADFRILHWEDRTADLKKLAFRLIMSQGGSRESVLGWTGPNGCSGFTNWKDIGYYVLVGRRTEN